MLNDEVWKILVPVVSQKLANSMKLL